jgi:hypothetical protein
MPFDVGYSQKTAAKTSKRLAGLERRNRDARDRNRHRALGEVGQGWR